MALTKKKDPRFPLIQLPRKSEEEAEKQLERTILGFH